MTITAEQIPGYRTGTWTIDPTHTEVGFSVRHLAISKVKGKFERFAGTFVTAENPLDSTVEATVEVDTADALPEDEADVLVGISGFCVACPRLGVCAACRVLVRGVDWAFVLVPVDPTCCFEHACWYAAAVCGYFACAGAVDGVFSG